MIINEQSENIQSALNECRRKKNIWKWKWEQNEWVIISFNESKSEGNKRMHKLTSRNWTSWVTSGSWRAYCEGIKEIPYNFEGNG